ncbi:PQQ-dependent sugar dehydrogenase [Radiobacillus deserti]|nr:PQQ-dependent sugar dehydrogenase [Radiobacillus deserti]
MRWLAIAGMGILLIGCSNQEDSSRHQTTENSEYEDSNHSTVKVIASQLEEPWEIVPYKESIYVSERKGLIVEIVENEQKRKPVQFHQELSDKPEAGLLGLVLPEDFQESKRAIAYYSYVQAGNIYQRVTTLIEEDTFWQEGVTILDQIPGGTYHQGGRLEIGPDQKLYITTGDATMPDQAQNLESLAGKILRVNLDGSIPSDNPFPNSPIYSYGHRNPQGMTWTNDGVMYATEHGNQAHDELNHIQKGSNYGWPIIQGNSAVDGMEKPIIHSGEDTWAPSGLAYYRDYLYFAGLRGQSIFRYDIEQEQLASWLDGFGRIRDVQASETGLYFITNNTDGRGNPSSEDDQLLFKRWE